MPHSVLSCEQYLQSCTVASLLYFALLLMLWLETAFSYTSGCDVHITTCPQHQRASIQMQTRACKRHCGRAQKSQPTPCLRPLVLPPLLVPLLCSPSSASPTSSSSSSRFSSLSSSPSSSSSPPSFPSSAPYSSPPPPHQSIRHLYLCFHRGFKWLGSCIPPLPPPSMLQIPASPLHQEQNPLIGKSFPTTHADV